MSCAGYTDKEVLEHYRSLIRSHGWAIVYVQGDDEEAAFAYTIGLTRFHGHPELLVSGLGQSPTARLLNELGARVRAGDRFRAGDLLPGPDRHRDQFVRVEDPEELILAQEIYASRAGLVPALQVVYSDHDGNWPWAPQWPDGSRVQPLFGTPLQPS